MGRPGPKPRPFEYSEPVFWYLVGLIASDGCLFRRGWLVDITSKDRELLVRIQQALGSRGWLRTKRGSSGNTIYAWQLKSRLFWERLTAIGLTPRKSLTIGPLVVPAAGFRDFLRGVIDGDGCIRRWKHSGNGREQWSVRIVGCSREFLAWVQAEITRLWHIGGALHAEARAARRHTKYTLKYGKLAAKVLLADCYYPGALALSRKQALAEQCLGTPVGWSRSKTVTDNARWQKWTYRHVWHAGVSERQTIRT